MNLLSLINSWLDIICQVKTKRATVAFHPPFHQLNAAWNGDVRPEDSDASSTLHELGPSLSGPLAQATTTVPASACPFKAAHVIPLKAAAAACVLVGVKGALRNTGPIIGPERHRLNCSGKATAHAAVQCFRMSAMGLAGFLPLVGKLQTCRIYTRIVRNF